MMNESGQALLQELRSYFDDLSRKTGDPEAADYLKRIDDLLLQLPLSEGIDFKRIVDEMPVGLGIVRGDGLYLYCNQAYTNETGVLPEYILNRYVQDIAKEGIYFRNPCSIRVLNSGHKVSAFSSDNAFGQHKTAYTIGVPLFDPEGEMEYVVTTMFNTETMRNFYNEFRDSQKKSEGVRIFDGSEDLNGTCMVGTDKQMENIRRLVEKAAPTDATILIVGESGVGKELVADLVYSSSKRKNKPFVKINCAAIPGNLLESELFGYEKGSFTGANTKGKAGLLEIADGGTVLLDEIGEMPLELQPKLLRFLQQGTIYRIGGSTAKKLNVRVIAATNAKLKDKVADGSFRDDLYYRLSVFPISVPPLRQRIDDIRKLAEHYFQVYCKKYGKSILVSEPIYLMFENYSWPGNIRELQNVVEYLVICAEPDEEVEPLMLQSLFSQEQQQPESELGAASLYEMRCRFERNVIINALRHSSSLRETAKLLDLAPSSLLRKAQKYNLDVPSLLNKK